MQRDARGLALSTDSTEAARLIDRATAEYLDYRKTTLATVTEALDARLNGDAKYKKENKEQPCRLGAEV